MFVPLALNHEIGSFLRSRYGVQITADNVVVTGGRSAAVSSSIKGLVHAGDRVLVPDPSDPLYAKQVSAVGAEAVRVPNRFDGSLDLAAIEKLAGESRVVVLCNPGNPTGRVHGPDELAGLAGILEANPKLLLLADEAHADLVYDGVRFESALQLPTIARQVIYCGTFPDSYSMSGLLGYVVTSRQHSSAIAEMHQSVYGHVDSLVQEAGLAALQAEPDDLRALAASYQRRRDVVENILAFTPGVRLRRPQGAVFAFPQIAAGMTSAELTRYFASNGLTVTSGTDFGPSGEGHVRISFASDMVSLIDDLHKFAEAVRLIVPQ